MIENALKILSEHVAKGERLAVAVSGGMDSMCLLHLVINSGIVPKGNILVVNVDHGIRAGSSKSDSQFVLNQCQVLGVQSCCEVLDIPSLASKNGKSIETQARDERRRIFSELINSGKVSKVLTAHHKDDQVETILMHIFRGCGLGGLVGMRALENGILRPLLTTSKQEIEEYITANKIPFITDETNLNSDYNRNYLRNEIMPLIRARWQGANNALLSLSKSALENEAFIDEHIDNQLSRALEKGTELLVTNNAEGDGLVVSLRIECLENAVLAFRFITKALGLLGIKADIERKHIALIHDLIDQRNGARLSLTSGITAAKEYDYITFYRREADLMREAEFLVGEFSFLNRRIRVLPCEPIIKKGELRIDADKLPKGAVIRARREGDIFKPVGGGTKKLKEYLIDKKIPKRLRGFIPCLAIGNQILLVLGVEISEQLKIEPNTKNALSVSLLD